MITRGGNMANDFIQLLIMQEHQNLKLAEWQYNKLITNLRNYNIRELKEEIVKLSNIDYEYKSGLINKDVILINYIIDLCS